MIRATCIDKFKDKQGRIIGYRLRDQQGNIRDFNHDVLKAGMIKNQIYIDNLQVATDGRIVKRGEKVEQSKSQSKPTADSKLYNVLVNIAKDIRAITHDNIQVKPSDFSEEPELVTISSNAKEKSCIRIKAAAYDMYLYIMIKDKVYIGYKYTQEELDKYYSFNTAGQIAFGVMLHFSSLEQLIAKYSSNKMLMLQILGVIDSNNDNKFECNVSENYINACRFYTSGSQGLNAYIKNFNKEQYESDYSSSVYSEIVKQLDRTFKSSVYKGREYVFRTILSEEQSDEIKTKKLIEDNAYKSTSQSLNFCLNWSLGQYRVDNIECAITCFKLLNKNSINTRNLYKKDQFEITVDRIYDYSKKSDIDILVLAKGYDDSISIGKVKLYIMELVEAQRAELGDISVKKITPSNYIDAFYQKLISMLSASNCTLYDCTRYYSQGSEYPIPLEGAKAHYKLSTLDNKYIALINSDTKDVVLKANIGTSSEKLHNSAALFCEHIINNAFIDSLKEDDVRYFDICMKQSIAEQGFDIIIGNGFGLHEVQGENNLDSETYTWNKYKYSYYINGNSRNKLRIMIFLERLGNNRLCIKYTCKSDNINVNNKIEFNYSNIKDKYEQMQQASTVLFKDIVNKLHLDKYNKLNKMFKYAVDTSKYQIKILTNDTILVDNTYTIKIEKGTDWEYILGCNNSHTSISGYSTIHTMYTEFKYFISSLNKGNNQGETKSVQSVVNEVKTIEELDRSIDEALSTRKYIAINGVKLHKRINNNTLEIALIDGSDKVTYLITKGSNGFQIISSNNLKLVVSNNLDQILSLMQVVNREYYESIVCADSFDSSMKDILLNYIDCSYNINNTLNNNTQYVNSSSAASDFYTAAMLNNIYNKLKSGYTYGGLLFRGEKGVSSSNTYKQFTSLTTDINVTAAFSGKDGRILAFRDIAIADIINLGSLSSNNEREILHACNSVVKVGKQIGQYRGIPIFIASIEHNKVDLPKLYNTFCKPYKDEGNGYEHVIIVAGLVAKLLSNKENRKYTYTIDNAGLTILAGNAAVMIRLIRKQAYLNKIPVNSVEEAYAVFVSQTTK